MKALLRNNLVTYALVCSLVWFAGVENASADIFDDANLVGFWQFNGDANDNSGTGNHGTLCGDANVSEDILALDGTGDYVNVGNDSSLKPSLPISVSMWVEPNSVGIYQGLFDNDRTTASNYYGIWAYIKTDDTIAISYGDGGSPGPTSRRSKVSASTVSNNEWQHIAFVIRGAADMDIYIDANDTGGTYSGTGGAVAYSNADGSIGAHVDNAFFLDGNIDDVMVYKAALADWEVRQLYDRTNKAYGHFNEVVADVLRGSTCTASGDYSFATGYSTTASGDYAVAMGKEATASGLYATAIGHSAEANDVHATAIGWDATASGDYCTAMGPETTASGYAATAIGAGATASGSASTAIGITTASGTWSIAIGKNFTNSTDDSFMVGYYDVDLKVANDAVNVYGDLDVSAKLTMATMVLPVKTTTGDPGSPVEGQIYVNTYDNKIRVYADGAWRDLATW